MSNTFFQNISITIQDPITKKNYNVSLTREEMTRYATDPKFQQLKLAEAKNLEYAQSISENDAETVQALDPDFNFDKNLEDDLTNEDAFVDYSDFELSDPGINLSGTSEVISEQNGDSAFRWSDSAVLLLIDEYRKREQSFHSGKVGQATLWNEISTILINYGHKITGNQCQSKFRGLKRTYKNIKDENNKSGNSRKSWPYFDVMDELIGDKPSTTPKTTTSSTGKRKRSSSELSENSSKNDSEKVTCKKAKTSGNQLLTLLNEKSAISEENKDRRFREYMEMKIKYKERTLKMLEKLVSSSDNV